MGAALCPRDYSDGQKCLQETLRSGDVLLSRDPAFGKAGACVAQAFLCWGVNHGGLAVDPAEFPENGHMRTRMPHLVPGKKYMLHALLTGVKVWDIEGYLKKMAKGKPRGVIYARHLQIEGPDAVAKRSTFLAAMDTTFGEVVDKAYESNFLSMFAGYCDACEECCPCCQSGGDDKEVFCSELMASVYIAGGALSRERPADEFTPTDFLDSDGVAIEKTSFNLGYALGPIETVQALPESALE